MNAHYSNYADITAQQFGPLIAVCCVGKVPGTTTELWKFQCTCCAGFVVRRKGNIVHNPPKRCQVVEDMRRLRVYRANQKREQRTRRLSNAAS
jgi:hypothetical protein